MCKFTYKFFRLIIFIISLKRCFGSDLSCNQKLVDAARAQIGVTVLYDPAYIKLNYPNGDVSLDRGVCTDVVVRALRAQGIDLQKNIHEHMKKNWNSYLKKWALSRPDPNIDHRRVPNIITYLTMNGFSLNLKASTKNILPGDIIVWDLGNGMLHIGIVSDALVNGTKRYKIIHNICCGVKEEDILNSFKIVAHFRVTIKAHQL